MPKPPSKMSARELIEAECNSTEITSDLTMNLADRLTEALTLLEALVKQCEEYSDNELVIDWETNKSWTIKEIKEFIGNTHDTTTS